MGLWSPWRLHITATIIFQCVTMFPALPVFQGEHGRLSGPLPESLCWKVFRAQFHHIFQGHLPCLRRVGRSLVRLPQEGCASSSGRTLWQDYIALCHTHHEVGAV